MVQSFHWGGNFSKGTNIMYSLGINKYVQDTNIHSLAVVAAIYFLITVIWFLTAFQYFDI